MVTRDHAATILLRGLVKRDLGRREGLLAPIVLLPLSTFSGTHSPIHPPRPSAHMDADADKATFCFDIIHACATRRLACHERKIDSPLCLAERERAPGSTYAVWVAREGAWVVLHAARSRINLDRLSTVPPRCSNLDAVLHAVCTLTAVLLMHVECRSQRPSPLTCCVVQLRSEGTTTRRKGVMTSGIAMHEEPGPHSPRHGRSPPPSAHEHNEWEQILETSLRGIRGMGHFSLALGVVVDSWRAGCPRPLSTMWLFSILCAICRGSCMQSSPCRHMQHCSAGVSASTQTGRSSYAVRRTE